MMIAQKMTDCQCMLLPEWTMGKILFQNLPSYLGQSHASAYRRNLAVSSTIISYICLCGLRFKPHWMFQIYKEVIKGHEEWTSCTSLMHSYLFPLLDVLYKWSESGFRPPLCTYRLNWARRTSWGWWDDWDDTVLQTQDSKFEPWRSEAEHATSRSRRLLTILTRCII